MWFIYSFTDVTGFTWETTDSTMAGYDMMHYTLNSITPVVDVYTLENPIPLENNYV
jgi:hypothetical protein